MIWDLQDSEKNIKYAILIKVHFNSIWCFRMFGKNILKAFGLIGWIRTNLLFMGCSKQPQGHKWNNVL